MSRGGGGEGRMRIEGKEDIHCCLYYLLRFILIYPTFTILNGKVN